MMPLIKTFNWGPNSWTEAATERIKTAVCVLVSVCDLTSFQHAADNTSEVGVSSQLKSRSQEEDQTNESSFLSRDEKAGEGKTLCCQVP